MSEEYVLKGNSFEPISGDKTKYSLKMNYFKWSKVNRITFSVMQDEKELTNQIQKRPDGKFRRGPARGNAIFRQLIDLLWTYLVENDILFNNSIEDVCRYNSRYKQTFNYLAIQTSFEILDDKHRFLKILYSHSFKWPWYHFEKDYKSRHKKYLEENEWARMALITFLVRVNKINKIWKSKKYKWIIEKTPHFYFHGLCINKSFRINGEIVRKSFKCKEMFGRQNETTEFIKLFNGGPCIISIQPKTFNIDSFLKFTGNPNIRIKCSSYEYLSQLKNIDTYIDRRYFSKLLEKCEDKIKIVKHPTNLSNVRLMNKMALEQVLHHLERNLDNFKNRKKQQEYRLKIQRMRFMLI